MLRITSFSASCASAWTPEEGIREHHTHLTSAELRRKSINSQNRLGANGSEHGRHTDAAEVDGAVLASAPNRTVEGLDEHLSKRRNHNHREHELTGLACEGIL